MHNEMSHDSSPAKKSTFGFQLHTESRCAFLSTRIADIALANFRGKQAELKMGYLKAFNANQVLAITERWQI